VPDSSLLMVSGKRSTPSLRRDLLLSTAALFVAALLIAVAAAVVTLPQLSSPAGAALFIALLVGADLAILFLFLRSLFRKALFGPLERMGADAERIAGGEYGHRIADGDAEELDRLARSLNTMAEKLIAEQKRLAESVDSLDRANRELVATTDDLVRSARMASVGTLAAGLAHEVGNPLGALVGYLDVARTRVTSRSASGAEVLPLVESALEEAGRIDRIVRSVLDFAEPAGGNRRVAGGFQGEGASVSIESVIERTLSLLEGRGALAGVEVRVVPSQGVHPVGARSQHLEQILMNLLMNAVWAAKEGEQPPQVWIRVAPAGDGESGANGKGSEHGVGGQKREVAVDIADSGPGISPENLERIFDPFFTTRSPGEGTGLGLAITRRIVRELGGRIEAFPQEGGGSLFRVWLPVVDAKGATQMGGAG